MCFLYLTGLYVLGLLSFQTIRIFNIILPGFFSDDIYHHGDLNTVHPSCISTEKKKPIIICGDLNVAATPLDIKNPKANEGNAGYTPEEREKFQTLLQTGFVDTFRYLHPDKQEFSWWSYRANARARDIGWRLDYFLLSDFAKDKISDAKILKDIYGSDHCPVLLDMEV